MINCLIIDDEPLAIDILSEYIDQIPDLHLIARTTNPLKGVGLLQLRQIDVLFLDIQMPQLNGIELLQTMKGRNCEVILTTAHAEYALDGYELSVLDYLLKPIAFSRFKRAIEKVRQSRARPSQDEPSPFIFVKSDYKLQKIVLQDILYIEGLKDYISIFTKSGRIITLQNLKAMEAALPTSRFSRVHRSYIVALDKITSIEKSKICIEDKRIPIGDTYKEAFLNQVYKQKP